MSNASSTLQRPDPDDHAGWMLYWETLGHPWRTEPEISKDRQAYLTQRRNIVPDIKHGIYPFKDIQLNRADIEWLLATHEDGRGPIDWNNEIQRGREGLDLRGADLKGVDLHSLPLARIHAGLTRGEQIEATHEQRHQAVIHLEQANLAFARLKTTAASPAVMFLLPV